MKNNIGNIISTLETLSEAIGNELQEIVDAITDSSISKHIKVSGQQEFHQFIKNLQQYCNNIESYNDSVYGVFENLNCIDGKNNAAILEKENSILKSLLLEKLENGNKYDESNYIRLKYGIDIHQWIQ